MKSRLPLVLVVVSLTLLAVLPFPVQWRINALNAEILELAEPARHAVTEIQGALALESAGARGFLLTGDPHFTARYREAHARRVAAATRLTPLARKLLGTEAHDITLLMGDLRPSDALLDSIFTGQLPRQTYLDRLNIQQARLEDAVRTSIRIDEKLRDAEEARQAQIQVAYRVGTAFSIAFVLLAALAAFLVARLGAAAERARRDLETATASRTRLVRGFTHDVKNPLGAADGHLALLEEGIHGQLAEPQKQSVARARRSIRTALDLTQQLLDLARAEAGQLEIHRVRMDLRDVARDVADAFRAQAETSGLGLDLDVSQPVPPCESDPARVQQVLANLVSNAIKYTPRGGQVAIRVTSRRDHDGSGDSQWVLAEVRDSGRGIPRDKQRLLFREFTRFDPNAAEGVGLGLAISQRIASALNGEITVASEQGTGSTFTLRLPASSSKSSAL